jgi:hypothetical protein
MQCAVWHTVRHTAMIGSSCKSATFYTRLVNIVLRYCNLHQLLLLHIWWLQMQKNTEGKEKQLDSLRDYRSLCVKYLLNPICLFIWLLLKFITHWDTSKLYRYKLIFIVGLLYIGSQKLYIGLQNCLCLFHSKDGV